jgi:hypothetical protein
VTARRLSPFAHADLLLALACSVAVTIAVLAAPDATLARVTLGIPLVLVVPGYAMTVALFGEHRPDGPALVVWALSLSIALTILSALALDALGVELTAAALTLTLAGIGAGAALVAGARRPAGTRRPPAAAVVALARTPWTAAVVAVAAVFAVLLVALREPTPNTAVPGYTQLAAQREPGGVRVALQSAEQRPTRYRVRVVVARALVAERTATLAAGQRWSRVVARSAAARASTVSVAVYRAGVDRGGPYRRLQLRP